MRKLSAFLVFIISVSLFYLLLSSYTLYTYQLKQIRKEMKTFLKSDVPQNQRVRFYLEDLQSDCSQVKWIHKNEFRYKGEMYDVITRTTEGNLHVLICVHDVKESALFRHLDQIVHRASNTENSKCKTTFFVQQFLQSLFLEKIELNNVFFRVHTLYYCDRTLSLACIEPCKDSPPPEQALRKFF